jgi:hypothetical protein
LARTPAIQHQDRRDLPAGRTPSLRHRVRPPAGGRAAQGAGRYAASQHLGDSSANVGAFPPKSFDWFYIDGDHGYDGVVRDLAAADAALKPGGYFMCNDYTVWAPMEAQPYGVPRAINEFIMRRRYRIVGYAFHFAGMTTSSFRSRTMPTEVRA